MSFIDQVKQEMAKQNVIPKIKRLRSLVARDISHRHHSLDGQRIPEKGDPLQPDLFPAGRGRRPHGLSGFQVQHFFASQVAGREGKCQREQNPEVKLVCGGESALEKRHVKEHLVEVGDGV